TRSRCDPSPSALFHHDRGLVSVNGRHLQALRLLALLPGPHLRIRAIELEQSTMIAALHDASVVHYEDLVGIDNGRQPMRNHQSGAVFRDTLELDLNRLLGARV